MRLPLGIGTSGPCRLLEIGSRSSTRRFAEAMVLLVLADAVLEKFGGDSVPEVVRNLRGYLDNLSVR